MSNFIDAINCKNNGKFPVWMMRQAGRYQASYRKIKEQYSFIEICKNPKLSSQIAINAVEEFGFDAAIMFSDILFPLENLGFKLDFNPAPELSFLLQKPEDVAKCYVSEQNFSYQAESIALLKDYFKGDKDIIGFVGGIFTIYYFAVNGSSKFGGDLGFNDGRFDFIAPKIAEILYKNVMMQIEAGADVIAIFDSLIENMNYGVFTQKYTHLLENLIKNVRKKSNIPIIYYCKTGNYDYLKEIANFGINTIAVDDRLELNEIFRQFSNKSVHGNFSQEFLALPNMEFRKKLDIFLENLPMKNRHALIPTIGHGILKTTPEENVREFVEIVKTI